MIYFDHAATTPLHPEVLQSIHEVMSRYYGNPSSLHRLGVEAERLLTRARQQIADLLNTSPASIIFTSGGTESNNLAIKGSLLQYDNRGRHIVATQIEHASVHEVLKQLEARGYEVTYLPVGRNGQVDPDEVIRSIRSDTVLVTVMYVNNETGAIQPIEQIAERLRAYPKVLFHVDGVQAFGKLPLNLGKLGVHLMTLSAHKVHGPKGVGILYKREGLRLEPLLIGGGQEGGWRSGTENVPLIVGAAKAFRLATSKQQDSYEHVSKLRSVLLSKLQNQRSLVINSPLEDGLAVPHIVNISCPGVRSEVVVHALEEKGFYISSRSACSSKDDKPSRVLLAQGLSEELAASGLRISLADDHTFEQVERLADALLDVTIHLQSIIQPSSSRGG